MRMQKLNAISEKDVLAVIKISQLVQSGMKIVGDYEIEKDFHFVSTLKKLENSDDELFYAHVIRSHGWYGNIEINYGFFMTESLYRENIHVSQNVSVFYDMQNPNNYYFVCPIFGEEESCTELYLRPDYPLFGSKRALNIT